MNNVIIICMNNLNSNSFIVILFKSNMQYPIYQYRIQYLCDIHITINMQ